MNVEQMSILSKEESSRIDRRSKETLFFFQAEDGIRDVAVTGVQTCALPILGTSTGTTQASALTAVSSSSSQSPAVTQGGNNSSQSLTFAQGGANYAQSMANGPGASRPQGQCESFTVSSVSGNTLVAKSSNGSSVTIHTTASTSFRQAGKTVTASAIK